jgi:FMN phosphatase YigB (HAD superfamily)
MADVKASSDLCFNLYKGYGHTLLGLHAVGTSKVPRVTLKDYNNFVYSHIDYNEINLSNNDMEDIKRLLSVCNSKNVDVYLFSNAPKTWMNHTLWKQRELMRSLVDIRDVLRVSDNDEQMLKPLSPIYDLVTEMFQDRQIIFVDDSACNLQYTLTKSNWTNVLYCGVNSTINKNMYMMNDLEKLEELL